MPRKDALDFQAIRRRMAAEGGRQYWRSLEELADTDEFRQWLHREFPEQASQWHDEPSRRRFLTLMAASLALAGFSGCQAQPPERIAPYVQSPEQIIPGKPLLFATAMELGGMGMGLLVESHMGRPTKVEGNPDHPASLGATDAFAQASVLTLYDPDRSQVVKQSRRISTRDAFVQALRVRMAAHRENRGAGLRILTETITSPTLAAQLERLLRELPQAQWHQYEPVFSDSVRAGARFALGDDRQNVHTVYDFSKADVVLSLEADFFAAGRAPIPYARAFMRRRRVAFDEPARPQMNRLYVVESTPSLAGAKADHRWPLSPRQIVSFAYAVTQGLGIGVEPPAGLPPPGVPQAWIDAVVDDLWNYRLEDDPQASLVIAGHLQPPVVHALAHAMNHALGNVGQTVLYREPVVAHPLRALESLGALVEDMRGGRVETLIILGGNPVFTAPADFEFAEALARVPYRAHLSLYEDETSQLCDWHIPQTHYLESWSDVRAFDGTATIVQPLIAPLYSTCMAVHELLAALLGEPDRESFDIVREHWRDVYAGDSFEEFWRHALHAGVVPGTRASAAEVSLRGDFAEALADEAGRWDEDGPSGKPGDAGGLDIVFRPDPTIWDGRFANNGWLQELPKPLTKLTWDNAALVSPATAEELGLQNGQVVELRQGQRMLRLPVWVLPGQADRCLTLHFGYGGTSAGRVAAGHGFNVYLLRTSHAPWHASGARLRKTNETYPLVTTQHHHLMEGREFVRAGTLEQLRSNPDLPGFMKEGDLDPHRPSLYPEWKYDDEYKWGMVIDQTACSGCSACVVACQAENNIPVVGKEQVSNSREMHWLRIDTYYQGDIENPDTFFQPLPCMHCERAPCEPVCPVAATVHSDEGLNDMIYNRCVGTRYCSNNCPYKVRRFNFLSYDKPIKEHATLQMLQNPDVTVRSRGVMEKCTYCVQRINHARIEAEKEGRRIRAGEVMTACQEACPTEAIVFGDLNNVREPVRQRRDEPINYMLLGDLNTQPRTTYLAALRNPNPRIEPGTQA